MKKFLMKPPKWLKRILERSPTYRGWFIKQVCCMLHDEAMESFKKDMLMR